MKHYLYTSVVALCFVLLIPTAWSADPTGDKETTDMGVSWGTVSGGGHSEQIGSYRLGSTIGQAAVGTSPMGGHAVHSGYWQDFYSGCCVGLRGNLDGSPDEEVTLGDLTVMIDHLFISLDDLACWEEGNLDESLPEGVGSVTLGDFTVLIDNLFISLEDPPPCP